MREREREIAFEPEAYLDEGNEYVSEFIFPLVCVETFVFTPGKGVRLVEK